MKEIGILNILTLNLHTWILISSKWHFDRADVVVVDVAGTCLQVRSHTVGSRNIPAGRILSTKKKSQ